MDESEIVHYAFSSLTQMDAVQEEIVLDPEDQHGLRPTQMSLVSTRNCNPVVKDDSQCVDMVLEEEIVTDTHHDNGDELMMILAMSDERDEGQDQMSTSISTPDADHQSNNNNNNLNNCTNETSAAAATVEKSTLAQTQSPLLSSSAPPTATILPLVKIVPNYSANPNRIIMKIQAKEPPDTQTVTADSSQRVTGNGSHAEDGQEVEDEDEEEEETIELKAATSATIEDGKSVKVPREMKQLQKMVDSSKVLTDFLSNTTNTSSSTPGNKVRKSRKAQGRPKKGQDTAAPVAAGADNESPKRQSARALAAMEAQKQRVFAEVSGSGLDSTTGTTADDSTEMTYEGGDDLSMDYHSDNETNESVASGGTDSMSMKLLPKVNSNQALEIVPAPKEGNDAFCWRCHTDGVQLCCTSCVRSYHTKCFRTAQGSNWQCPDCADVAAAVKRMGSNLSAATEKLSKLLLFAWNRITQLKRSTETIDGFNASNYEDFDRVVQHPITLQDIERRIHSGQYRTAGEFTTDFKWILHNGYVYFSTCYTTPAEMGAVMKIAKSLLKTCKQEMGQIDTCAECYANANSRKNWFVEVCDPPHVLLWAKLKGFPFWPAKAMAVNGATLVDVRFFGAHDRAWVPTKDCYLYSQHNPNVYKLKNTTILQCIKEIEQHIAKVRVKYGAFEYGPAKEKYDPLRHTEQLQAMVPGYRAASSIPPVAESAGGGPLKTNLTYKIVKTGDNSCLISPVVKNGQPVAEEEAAATAVAVAPVAPLALPPPPREAIKPTKIVIKNSYDEKNNKQYELVTPTNTTTTTTDKEEGEEAMVGEEDTRRVDVVVMKRKSAKWSKLALKKRKGPAEGVASSINAPAAMLSREASPKRDDAEPEEATSGRGEMKRRNTEEVTPVVAPNKIKIRRMTRAYSRPLVESSNVPEVVEGEKEKEKEEKEEKKPEEVEEEKEKPEELLQTPQQQPLREVELPVNKPPITTVKDVLDQLPQISIVPSRKNSFTAAPVRSSGDNSSSRLSSRSSSKSGGSPGKQQQQQRPSQAVALEPLVKIEPISDDEVEVTVDVGGGGGGRGRSRSVEIVEEATTTTTTALNGGTAKGAIGSQPRARKTFARNIGNRPKPPAFNAEQVKNMVLIPRELSGEVGSNGRQQQQQQQPQSSPEHMLSGSITPSLAAAVTSLISQGPPRLIRKPNGTLQSAGDAVFPSAAGSSCRLLMENAHRMTDFFRSVLEDTLSDMADQGCLEAKVQLLQLELEKEKYKHQKELADLKSNTDLILCEMRSSLELEKTRAVNETRKQCEVERQQAVEQTKRRQWCASCGKEAQFYCCWNTSYCDYPCQQKHWPRHVKTCAQAEQTQSLATGGAAGMMSMGGGGGKGVPGTTTIRAKVTASAAAAAPRRKTGVGRAAVNGGNGTGKSFVNNSLAPMMTTAQRVYLGSSSSGSSSSNHPAASVVTAAVNNVMPGFAYTLSTDRFMNGGAVVGAVKPPWISTEALSIFPPSTTITATKPMAGTSFLGQAMNRTVMQQQQHSQHSQQGLTGVGIGGDPLLIFSTGEK